MLSSCIAGFRRRRTLSLRSRKCGLRFEDLIRFGVLGKLALAPVALLELLPAPAMTRVVAAELRLGPSIGLLRGMIVLTVGTVNVRCLVDWVGHGVLPRWKGSFAW
jgi:hypothetical protein